MALSYSRITTYQKCPYKYKLKYVDKLGFPESIYLKSGKKMHEIIAKRTEECIRLGMNIVNFTDISDYDKDAVDVLKDFTLNLPPDMKEYGIEKEFGITSDWKPCEFDSEEASYRGIIDFYAVDGDNILEIIDYKTGFRVMPKSEFAYDLQLKLYSAYLLALHENISQIYLTRYYPRMNRYHNILVNRQDIEEFKEELSQISDRICNDNEYKPIVTPQCILCDARHICESFDKYKKHYPETIEEMADKIKVYKGLVKDYEDALKTYLEENRLVETENFIVKSLPETRYKYSTPDVVKYLKENDVDNKAILKWGLSVNNTTLTKLFKKINREDLDDGVPCDIVDFDKLKWEAK